MAMNVFAHRFCYTNCLQPKFPDVFLMIIMMMYLKKKHSYLFVLIGCYCYELSVGKLVCSHRGFVFVQFHYMDSGLIFMQGVQQNLEKNSKTNLDT